MARIGPVVIVSLQRSQELGYPMENFARVRRAKAYAVAYLRTKSSHKTWVGANRSSGCGVTTSARIMVPDDNFPDGTSGPMPMPLHIDELRRFHNFEMVQSGPVVVEWYHNAGGHTKCDEFIFKMGTAEWDLILIKPTCGFIHKFSLSIHLFSTTFCLISNSD